MNKMSNWILYGKYMPTLRWAFFLRFFLGLVEMIGLGRAYKEGPTGASPKSGTAHTFAEKIEKPKLLPLSLHRWSLALSLPRPPRPLPRLLSRSPSGDAPPLISLGSPAR